MPRETAVGLIKNEVLPRLDKVEGILVAAGLDNGVGEGTAVLKKALIRGASAEHRAEVTRQFFHLWFGWVPVSRRTLHWLAVSVAAGLIASATFWVFNTAHWSLPAAPSPAHVSGRP